MIISISVTLEKIRKKDWMLEDLFSQSTWSAIGRGGKRGKNKAQFTDD